MSSRLTLAAPAVRPALKARLMLAAPSGGGKTKSGLIIATVLAADDDNGKILVIDTEKESALTYADDFTFVHLPWRPPYDPRELAVTITEAGHEYSVVMVDSTSHFWRKKGGTLDIANGKFTGWGDARPAQEDLVDAVLGCGAHVILCVRSKQEYVQEVENGKHVVKKLGMAAQQDDDLEFELNIACEIDMKHEIAVSKSRCDAVPVGRSFGAGHAQELAELYRDWLKVGEPPAPQADVDALVARIQALPEAARKACKGEFMATLGKPELMREVRLPEAEALVARFEAEGGGTSDDDPGSPTAPPPPDGPEPDGIDGGGMLGQPVSSGGGAADSPPAPVVGDSQSGEGAAPPAASSSAAPVEPGGEGAPAGNDGADTTASVRAPAPSGPVTAEQLLDLVDGAPAARKGKIAKAARSVAGALSIEFAGGFDDVLADQTLAAAVLADLRGDDRPPPPSGGGTGSAVGEASLSPEASAGDPPPVPDPTAGQPVDVHAAYKAVDPDGWKNWNAGAQAAARGSKNKPGLLDEDDGVRKEQRAALAFQVSRHYRGAGNEVTSWSAVSLREAREISVQLNNLEGRGWRLGCSSPDSPGGWWVERIDGQEAAA